MTITWMVSLDSDELRAGKLARVVHERKAGGL
jgi:hypothetical protein